MALLREAGDANSNRAPTTLDPADWQEFRRLSHRALDDVITQLETIETRPVWQPMPAAVRESFRQPLPHTGRDLADVLADFSADIAPYATGNRHPLFMGWVHGAGTPVGMLGEMLAAGLNANCGGRDHAGIEVERQVTRWVAEMFGFPAMRRTVRDGHVDGELPGPARCPATRHCDDIRVARLKAAASQLVAYASAQAHGCIAQALNGGRRLGQPPADPDRCDRRHSHRCAARNHSRRSQGGAAAVPDLRHGG
jgi:hypothetical protein